MADVSASTERPTIDQVLLEFLDDQQPRLSPRTWHRYAEVVFEEEEARLCGTLPGRSVDSTAPTTAESRSLASRQPLLHATHLRMVSERVDA